MDDNNQKYMLDLIDGAHGRTVRWMGRIIVILIFCWLATIGAIIWYLSLYDYVSTDTVTTTDYTQDSNGLNIISEGSGVSVNGTKIETDNANADENQNGKTDSQPPEAH